MTMLLQGSCRCGAIRYSVESHTPCPYQLCYCSICRKTAGGGGGHAINLGGLADTLSVEGREALRIFHAPIGPERRPSTAERNFCGRCGAALWVYDPTWPELVHPHASSIDTDLPSPPHRVHIFLADVPKWITPVIRDGDECFEGYPELSLEDWHRKHGVWAD